MYHDVWHVCILCHIIIDSYWILQNSKWIISHVTGPHPKSNVVCWNPQDALWVGEHMYPAKVYIFAWNRYRDIRQSVLDLGCISLKSVLEDLSRRLKAKTCIMSSNGKRDQGVPSHATRFRSWGQFWVGNPRAKRDVQKRYENSDVTYFQAFSKQSTIFTHDIWCLQPRQSHIELSQRVQWTAHLTVTQSTVCDGAANLVAGYHRVLDVAKPNNRWSQSEIGRVCILT